MRQKQHDVDVLVVGSGPVGLYTALSLAERGVGVEVIDREWRGASHSYALALHPQTLRLLDDLGAADALFKQGRRIEQIELYEGGTRLASFDLTALDGPFPCVLAVPQSALEAALEERLSRKGVKVSWNHQALAFNEGFGTVGARVGRMEKYSLGYPVARTEWAVAKELDYRAQFVVGADGYSSFVRRHLGVDNETVGASETFAVFEFPGDMRQHDRAAIAFQDELASVMWPLGPERGRWSFQLPAGGDQASQPTLASLVAARAPWFEPVPEQNLWTTEALFERRLVSRFGRDRIWLVGDAAHVTGPIGCQSMNVGIHEAHELTELLSSTLKDSATPDTLERFGRDRHREWRRLLGSEGQLTARPGSPLHGRRLVGRLLPCVPAAGRDLERLLGQVGLELS
ncbi:MAG TPA: NAD(P)/FAD-dependent oxidoreductase [Candidatus Polarisedimenticolaceae bacterium]|nr:NAD(P)/FAD-dependent oxidoreductase [Candidatus Polarisedimenticolaceae bacterium]